MKMKQKQRLLALGLALGLFLWGCARQEPEEQPGGGQPEPQSPQSVEATGQSLPQQPSAETDGPEPQQDQPVLEMEPSYPLDGQQIAYTLIVPEGQQAQVVLAPQLERQTDHAGWQPVPCDTGFCGTPDILEGRHEGALLTEWYPDLFAGNYRLSFRYWPGEERQSSSQSLALSAQFQLVEAVEKQEGSEK